MMKANFYNYGDTICIDPSNTLALVKDEKPQTLDEWEIFLSILDVSQREVLPENFDFFMAKAEEINISEIWREKNEDLFEVAIVNEAIETLNPCEKEIIDGLFWQGQSMRKISKTLGVPRTTASRIRDHALKKIENYVLQSSLIEFK